MEDVSFHMAKPSDIQSLLPKRDCVIDIKITERKRIFFFSNIWKNMCNIKVYGATILFFPCVCMYPSTFTHSLLSEMDTWTERRRCIKVEYWVDLFFCYTSTPGSFTFVLIFVESLTPTTDLPATGRTSFQWFFATETHFPMNILFYDIYSFY